MNPYEPQNFSKNQGPQGTLKRPKGTSLAVVSAKGTSSRFTSAAPLQPVTKITRGFSPLSSYLSSFIQEKVQKVEDLKFQTSKSKKVENKNLGYPSLTHGIPWICFPSPKKNTATTHPRRDSWDNPDSRSPARPQRSNPWEARPETSDSGPTVQPGGFGHFLPGKREENWMVHDASVENDQKLPTRLVLLEILDFFR